MPQIVTFTAITVNTGAQGITQPTTSNQNCAFGSVASSNNPNADEVDLYVSSGAPSNCTASIGISTSDGQSGTVYVVVP